MAISLLLYILDVSLTQQSFSISAEGSGHAWLLQCCPGLGPWAKAKCFTFVTGIEGMYVTVDENTVNGKLTTLLSESNAAFIALV
jgi:hypothetical protein